MKKGNLCLRVYVDSTFQPKDKQSYCCYYLEGLLNNEFVKEDKIINLGKTPDSTTTEYFGIEKTLFQIEKLIKSKKISKHKISLVVYTDLQVLPRQYKKWIAPPLDEVISKCFSRICEHLSKYNKADIFWIERKENIAGKILERFVNEGKKKENESTDFVFFKKIFEINKL